MRAMSTSLLLAVVAAQGIAHADSIAVLGIEAENASEADAARLTDALRQRLSGAGTYKVLPGKDYIELKMMFGCVDEGAAACMAQAGKSLGADKLVYGTLRGKKGAAKQSVTLRLLDVKTSNVDRYIPTEQVTSDELQAGTVNGVASRLLAALLGLEAKASLTITSQPEGAQVTVDDKARGTTPATVSDLGPGFHTVGVSKSGYQTKNESVNVRAGDAAKLDVTLQQADGSAPAVVETPTTGDKPDKPVETSEEHPGRSLKIVGAVGLVLAAAAGGAAIYTWRKYSGLQDDAHASLVQLSSADPQYANIQRGWFAKPDCTVPGNPPQGQSLNDYQKHCSDGQSLATATTGLWVGAGVLAAAGVTALVLGSRAHDSKERASSFSPRLRALAPSAGPTGGGVSATFEF